MAIDITSIGSGVAAGITFSVTSYWKKKDQEFKWNKLFTTIVIGGAAGLVMGLFDLPVGTAYEYVLALGAVPIVENFIKIVTRKWFNMDW